MDRQSADSHYSSRYVEDREGGCAGFELHRVRRDKQGVIATVLYWDATGQYWVETLGEGVPVDILEELIRETKQKIGYD